MPIQKYIHYMSDPSVLSDLSAGFRDKSRKFAFFALN